MMACSDDGTRSMCGLSEFDCGNCGTYRFRTMCVFRAVTHQWSPQLTGGSFWWTSLHALMIDVWSGYASVYAVITTLHTTVFFPGLNMARRIFLIVAASYVIIVSVIRLLLEMFQFVNLKLYYLLDWVNWTEVLLFVCSIIFVSVYRTDCLCPTRWQWQIGCVAVFLSWIILIIFFRKIPLTGQ